MKWIVLAVGAVILYFIFRLISREQKAVAYPSDPSQPIASAVPTPTEFALRTPMSFEEFYSRYYADGKIDRAFVKKILEYVSKAGGVPAEQLRPEDRLDTLPKRTASLGARFVEKMLSAGLRHSTEGQGAPVVEFHLDTIDSLIRQLEPHHLEAFSHDLHTD